MPEHNGEPNSLAGSGELFQAAWQAAPDAMILFDQAGRVLEVNQALVKLVGLSRDKIKGRDISLVFAQGLGVQGFARSIERNGGTGAPSPFEVTIRRSNGEERVLEINLTLLERNNHGIKRRIAMLATGHDVTDRKQVQRKLDEHSARQIELLRQLTTAQDAERRRLAMDLHDGPLQSLAVTLMALDRAKTRAARGEYDKAEKERSFARDLLTEIVQEMRATVADISSELLAERGFSVALQHHAALVSEASDIAVHVNDQVAERFPLEIEMLLYRLAQESIANARKHSEATEILVSVRKGTEEGINFLLLSISDNGRGFDVEEGLKKRNDGSGIGLGSMRQRIQAAGGKMEIVSQRGSGTVVQFWCPLF